MDALRKVRVAWRHGIRTGTLAGRKQRKHLGKSRRRRAGHGPFEQAAANAQPWPSVTMDDKRGIEARRGLHVDRADLDSLPEDNESSGTTLYRGCGGQKFCRQEPDVRLQLIGTLRSAGQHVGPSVLTRNGSRPKLEPVREQGLEVIDLDHRHHAQRGVGLRGACRRERNQAAGRRHCDKRAERGSWTEREAENVRMHVETSNTLLPPG